VSAIVISSAPALQVDRVTKRFGDLVANDTISFAVARGEILALLGENGAGKTTLMNIVFGHYVADSGRVAVAGQVLPPGDPRAALAAGIGMVHQHFTLADNLTVLDNIMLGTESLWRPRSDRRAARARLARLATQSGLAIDPDAPVGRLSVGEKQRVEILKALYRDVRLLILDEPTAVLTPAETEGLFATLRRLVAQGLSIVFISHKLGEVAAIADRIAVLRQGCVVLTRPCAGASRDELAAAMVGHRVETPRFAPGRPGATALRLASIEARSADLRIALHGVDLDLRFGEVLGIAGVAGNGQSLLADIVCGMATPLSGRLEIAGRDQAPRSPRGFMAAGIGRIPEDRHAHGVVGDFSVAENAVIERLDDPRFARRGWLRPGAMRAYAADLIARYDVRGAAPRTRARLLSGGNMQKLILGRVLDAGPRIVVANQPTRGLDVGAVAYVQTRLDEARARGAAILLISEDLEEVFALADRVAVMYRGRLSAPVPACDTDMRRIGLMMAGAQPEFAHAT
jgi:simple sugar transport system ATP-binding protein